MREVKLPFEACDAIVIACLKDDYEDVKASEEHYYIGLANAIRCLLRYYMVDSEYEAWTTSVGIEVDEN